MDIRQVPPQNLESEMSVLGGIMLDNSAIDKVLAQISINDFYRESHRKILEAMSSLSNRREPIDLITLTTELKVMGALEEVGGGAYLYTLVDYVPSATNISYYCKAVADASLMRRLLLCGQDIIGRVQKNESPEVIMEAVLSGVSSIAINKQKEPAKAKDLALATIKRIEHRFENRGQFTGIPYGWPDLDRVTNGLHPGDLIIIAGRPSMGKTAMAANIAENVCQLNHTAAIFSLEMAKEQLSERLISSTGPVDHERIRSGNLVESDWSKLMTGAGKIHDYNLHIDDTPAISLPEIRSKSKMIKSRYGLKLVVIDYLQLMKSSGKTSSREQEIAELSRGLKQLARELECPVIALSQLSRKLEERQDKRPMMSDLRESGAIEQDADLILFPFRPAVYCEKCKKKITEPGHDYELHQSEASIGIAKQRNGPANIDIPLAWQGRYQRFVSLAREEDQMACPYD